MCKVSNDERLDLANRIFSFIERHAGVRPDFDPKYEGADERFTGPDSALLCHAAERLKAGHPVRPVHSSYESGCYRLWNSVAAKTEHDGLIAEIKALSF